MAKAKQSTAFFCKECGYESAKWLGQCPGCKAWNTMEEKPVMKNTGRSSGVGVGPGALQAPRKLSEITIDTENRYFTGMSEVDRVLGGGIVQGSLVLVGGDPGIGKSTLLLQLCRNLADGEKKVLYVSGEESLRQIKMRADRLKVESDLLYLLCETNLTLIEGAIDNLMPDLVVIDSIQTMYCEEAQTAPGSVAQVRESTSALLRISKVKGISIFIVGHVTKEGVVAGPRMLEHMVDTVLYFEGDRSAMYRMLRGVKNRFGSTDEVGIFEMHEDGLCQVENPSAYMLEGRPKDACGDVITCSMEGTRAMLLEVQALVSQTGYGMPRRTAAGADYNRINLLMAVMEKRAGIHLGDCDAYVNLTSGIRVTEPALDLAMVMALASSYMNRRIPEDTVIFGEVGLAGEVRGISNVEQRLGEALKLGFATCLLPRVSMEGMNPSLLKNGKMRCVGVSNISEAIAWMKEL